MRFRLSRTRCKSAGGLGMPSKDLVPLQRQFPTTVVPSPVSPPAQDQLDGRDHRVCPVNNRRRTSTQLGDTANRELLEPRSIPLMALAGPTCYPPRVVSLPHQRHTTRVQLIRPTRKWLRAGLTARLGWAPVLWPLLCLAAELPLPSTLAADVQRATAERIRTLREAAAPGWRQTALELLRHRSPSAGAPTSIHPSSPDGANAEVQEAVTILGTEELWFESWKPGSNTLSTLLDLNQGRSLELEDSGLIRVRNLVDGRELLRLPVASPPDRNLVGLDPMGEWIASTDPTAGWRFRGVSTADLPSTLPLKSQGTAWISFHPVQPRLAIPGSDGSHPELWIGPLPLRGMTGVRRIPLPGVPFRCTWSPSGTRLAVLCRSLSAVVLIDPAQEGEVGRLEFPEQPVDFAWMPDARRILVATAAGISTGDTQTQTVEPFAATIGGPTAVDITDNGALMAVAVRTGRLEVWDFKAARRIAGIPSEPVNGLHWSPDATRLEIRREGTPTPRLAGFSMTRDVVHFVPPGATILPDSPQGPLLRWGTNGVWLKRGGGLPVRLPANAPISGAAVSPNSEWLHVKTADGVVREWNLVRLRQRLGAMGLEW